jgi:hypothetical protein
MTFDFGAIGSESQEPEVPDVPAPAALPDRASLIAGDAASIGEGAAAVARDEAPSMTEFATDRMESEGAPSADVVAVPVADRVSEAAIASTAHPKAPTTAQISVKPAPPPLPPAAPDKPIDVIIDRGVLPPIEPRAMPARILSRQGDDRGGAIAPTAPAPFPWLTMAAVFAAGLVVGGVIVHRMGAGQPAENPAPKLATASASVAAPPADTGVPASTTEVVVTPPVENATPPALSASSAAPSRSPAPPVASPGRLLIHTDPAGALVAVDGKAHGKATAAVRDLPLGAHTITVTLAGFDAETRHVTLTAAQPSRELTVSLRSTRSSSPGTPKAPPAAGRQAAPPAAASSSSQLKTGAIDIDSRPPGARVFVDGKAIGVTPLRVPEVAIGAHTVRIELTGYKTLTTTVQVTAGQPAKLNVSLEPAIVSITSEGMGKRGNGGMSPRREEMGK